MKNIIILTVLVIFLVGLLLWEIWPDRIEIVHLDFRKNQSSQLLSINCQELDLLLDKQWEIRYPHLITKNETKKISVVLLDTSSANSFIVTEESECDMAIEVFLDISGTAISPGSRIIEPYYLGSPLRFEWEIQAVDEDVSGIIWIYLVVDGDGGQFSRRPLFAYPVELRVITLMGFPPRVFRIIILALAIFSSGIYLLLKPDRRE
jgi:hypothetical protein